MSRGNKARIRLWTVRLEAAVKHRYTLSNIIAKQAMIKNPEGKGPQSLWSHIWGYSVPAKAGPLAKLEGLGPTRCRARDYCKGKWNHTDQWAED